jgi:hypothetical protein
MLSRGLSDAADQHLLHTTIALSDCEERCGKHADLAVPMNLNDRGEVYLRIVAGESPELIWLGSCWSLVLRLTLETVHLRIVSGTLPS